MDNIGGFTSVFKHIDPNALEQFNYKEIVGPYGISTVKLPIAHSWGDADDRSYWYETLVGSESGEEVEMRYRTADEARVGHVQIVLQLASKLLDAGL